MTFPPRYLGALIFAIAALLLSSCSRHADEASAAKTAAPVAAPSPAAGLEQVKRVTGKWLREDGGYVLEIKGGAAGGVLEATYFNPQQNRAINVSRAAWFEGGGKLQVLVELNDEGYPGATYVLQYESAADKLIGQYQQPAMQQTFAIEFVRPKP
jgi:hypothetical protein